MVLKCGILPYACSQFTLSHGEVGKEGIGVE